MEFNQLLLEKYNTSGPRYTSYPTANNFSAITLDDYKKQVLICNNNTKQLSLYIHIPFCDNICFYCGCNKIASKNLEKSTIYLQYLYKEIDLQAQLFDKTKEVRQVHFGGGTPTFLTNDEIYNLSLYLQNTFNFTDDCEISIEIDPRSVNDNTFEVLQNAGFNRLSFGVQDFDAEVQIAINREQSFELVEKVIQDARNYDFISISIDLIYGLPKQNLTSWKETLRKVGILKSDRISLFNYAHLPNLFKPQRRINENDLPKVDEKIQILETSINFLLEIGYNYIGMDHFALPNDELSLAQHNNSLYRNFQGYSTYKDCDMIGFGVSSIGNIVDIFSQNYKTLDEYYQHLDNNQLPIAKGQNISFDDKVRKEVIMQLICNFSLQFKNIENMFDIDFNNYFKNELLNLIDMQHDKLLNVDDKNIAITALGKFFIRSICMVFDNYLQHSNASFSKVL